MPRKSKTNRSQDFLGYIRVSTGDQLTSGLGLEAQRSAIEAACQSRGWTLGTVFEDAASGSSVNRPGLQLALSALADGQGRGLVVSKLDRLTRTLGDFAHLMERSRREGWALVALDLGVDTTSPAGEMMANVMASFAMYERQLIGLRTKEALAEKRAQGAVLGRPRSIPEDSLARILELRDAGMSYRQMADQLNAEGVPTGQGGRWHSTTLYRALKSRAEDQPG